MKLNQVVKNKPVKKLSKILRNFNKNEVVIDTIDDECDMNYNVKVSNIFSPLKVLEEESMESEILVTKEEAFNVKTGIPVKLGSHWPLETGPGLTDSPLPNTSAPSPRPCSSDSSSSNSASQDCTSGTGTPSPATSSSPFRWNLDHHFDKLLKAVENYEKKRNETET